MRALVTGGAGFIGSHLVERLLAQGHGVTVLDNLSNGREENLPAGADLVSGDVRWGESWLSSVVEGHDVIFHLAATQDFRNSLVDHRVDFENNIAGTLNLLEAAHRNGVPDFVLAQTTALYGENDGTPMPETYVGIQTNLYGATKLAAGALAEAYTQLSDMRLWTFRFGRVLGARERKGAIWDFVEKLKDDPPELEVLGNGKQSRTYIHVDDLVDGILFGYANSGDKVNVFNLAAEERVTIDELARIFLEAVGRPELPIRHTSTEPRGYVGDNPQVHLSIDKIRALGWAPRRTAREAIVENTIWAAKERGLELRAAP